MNDMSNPVFAVVERFATALEQGDLEGLESCFAPNVEIWHNFDQKWMTLAENAVTVGGYFTNFSRRDYSNRRVSQLPGGALLQFVAGLESQGKQFNWPGCIVFQILDGKITKLEEYVDLSSLTAALA